MCTSACQGNCKNLTNNIVNDPKLSLMQMITGLNKMSLCTNKSGFINGTINSYSTALQGLKDKAIQLLEEVNCHTEKFPDAVAKCKSSYVSENVYEEHSLKERVKQLKQEIQLLEKAFI